MAGFDIYNPFGTSSGFFGKQKKQKNVKAPSLPSMPSFTTNTGSGTKSDPFKAKQPDMNLVSPLIKNTDYVNSGTHARLSNISIGRAAAEMTAMQNSPNLAPANKIRVNLGMKELFPDNYRRRQGRYDARWAQTSHVRKQSNAMQPENDYSVPAPYDFLKEHYKKESLVNWGKTKGLKLDVTDTGTFRTGSYAEAQYWTHNGSKRLTGYNEKTTYRTGKPENKDQETEVLFNKMQQSTAAKKARYVKLFEPAEETAQKDIATLDTTIAAQQAHVDQTARNNYQYRITDTTYLDAQTAKLTTMQEERVAKAENAELIGHSYYGVTNTDLDKAESYKQELIADIKQTDATDDKLRKKQRRKPDDDSGRNLQDMRLDRLSQEAAQEKAQLQETYNIQAKRQQTADLIGAAGSRSRLNPVKLATRKPKGQVRTTGSTKSTSQSTGSPMDEPVKKPRRSKKLNHTDNRKSNLSGNRFGTRQRGRYR